MNRLCFSILMLACGGLAACNRTANDTMLSDTPAVAQSAPANTGTAMGASAESSAPAMGTSRPSSDAGGVNKPAN